MSEESIFTAAIEIERGEKRQFYLDKVCRNDLEMRGRVEALISAHETDHRLVDQPIELRETQSSDAFRATGPGSQIGRYKLLQQIGEGGFGIVYMAEQVEPVRRRVALKVIKPGMDSREAVARFEAERQALAMMDHPNIAQVLDAGTTESGHPYFVMELVKGIPITKYADDNQLSTRERLKLFIQVCHAVQHAHQKGVIHRDLKPTNVMVTLHDGVPVPKVIDFGVSKALNQQLTEKTLFTRYGQIIGTPQYMSPEQAEMSGLDVDTRSDVYSLGVLLYELLTGRPPFDSEILRAAGIDEMRRMIREQDPPKPSDRLRTLDAKTATMVASHRSSQPKALTRFVKGELDWIVMKALEKTRERRFDSAGNFATEIQRYLVGDAIQTHAPSLFYLACKRFKRHRAAFVLTGLMFLLISSAGIYSFIAYLNAKDARDQLAEEQKITEASFELLVEMIQEANPQVLEQFAEKSTEVFAKNPSTEFKVLGLLLNKMMESNVYSESVSQRYVDLAISNFGKQSQEYVRALGVSAINTDNQQIMESAIEIAEANNFDPDFRTLSAYGAMLVQKEQFGKAIKILNRSIEGYRFDEVNVPLLELPFLWLAEARRCIGDHQGYRSSLDRGIDELLRFYPDKSPTSWDDMFGIWSNANTPCQAEWTALGGVQIAEDASLTQQYAVVSNLAHAYRRKGQTKDALQYYNAGLEIAQKYERSDSRLLEVGWRQCHLGRVYRNIGDDNRYEQYLREGIETFKQTDHPWGLYWLKLELGVLLYHQGKRGESSDLFKEVHEKIEPFVDDTAQTLWTGPKSGDRVRIDFGVYVYTALLAGKKVDESLIQRLHELDSPDSHPAPRGWIQFVSAYYYLQQEEYTQFVRCFQNHRENIDYWDTLNLPIHEDFMLAKLFESDQKTVAVDLVQHIVKIRDEKQCFGHPQRGLTRLRIARLLIQHQLRPDLAKTYLEQAKQILTGHELLPQKHLTEIDELLKKVESGKAADDHHE